MRGHEIDKWKWGIWAAVVITVLSAYPQFVMWGVRGQQWNGSFAEGDIDEWVYAAYVQALIGRVVVILTPGAMTNHTGPSQNPCFQFSLCRLMRLPFRRACWVYLHLQHSSY